MWKGGKKQVAYSRIFPQFVWLVHPTPISKVTIKFFFLSTRKFGKVFKMSLKTWNHSFLLLIIISTILKSPLLRENHTCQQLYVLETCPGIEPMIPDTAKSSFLLIYWLHCHSFVHSIIKSLISVRVVVVSKPIVGHKWWETRHLCLYEFVLCVQLALSLMIQFKLDFG